MTVFFWVPDVNYPAGGVRAAYRIVDALNAAHHPAAIMHQRKNFRATWFPSETRVVDAQTTLVFGNDLLVVSELDAPRLLDKTPGITKVIFNQNHRWTFVPGRVDYRRPDVAAMVVVSEDGEKYMRYAYPGMEVTRIHYGVDTGLFRPTPGRQRVLLYHSTKGALGRELALSMLHLRGVLDGWTTEPVSGLSQHAFADKLGCSAALVTASQEEGFPLLLVEAMAAGCAVVGYPAAGAVEYMTTDVAWPVVTGDHLALSRSIEEFVGMWTNAPEEIERRTTSARALVEQRYNLTVEAADAVLAFGSNATRAAAQPAGQGCKVAEIIRFETTRKRTRAAVRGLIRG